MTTRSRSGSSRSGGGKTGKKRPAKPLSAATRSVYANNVLEGFFPAKSETMEKMMNKSKNQMDKMAQEASAMGRDGMDAMIKSSTLFAKGMEEIMRTASSLMQGAAEKQAQFMNQALGSKTLNELTEVQNKIAQSTFDDCMAAATRLSEMSIRMMSECSEPLNDQLGRTMKKASESMAA